MAGFRGAPCKRMSSEEFKSSRTFLRILGKFTFNVDIERDLRSTLLRTVDFVVLLTIF
jgi:hypothetical protein